MSIRVYVDFDGTIMPCDTTDYLLERFALPEWHAIEEEWAAGRIGSRECMARQVELLRATPAQLEAAAAELEIDPGVPGFLAACQRHGLEVAVVSDGLDAVIRSTLARNGLDIPYYANHLVHAGGDRWRLEFPHSRAACATGAGHCKCARTESHPDALSVVVGDGRSDFCIAGRADIVLAKSKLIEECRSNGIPHLSFRGFDEATELLESWLSAGSIPGHGTARIPLEV
jgi:2-hydroxy-3-keto-5-methylthiopentenyl-1-phosphate phosphatase